MLVLIIVDFFFYGALNRLHIHFQFHLIKLEIWNIMMETYKLQEITIFGL